MINQKSFQYPFLVLAIILSLAVLSAQTSGTETRNGQEQQTYISFSNVRLHIGKGKETRLYSSANPYASLNEKFRFTNITFLEEQ